MCIRDRCAGVEWILAQGVETLCAKETALAALFYKNIRDLPNVVTDGNLTGGLKTVIDKKDIENG